LNAATSRTGTAQDKLVGLILALDITLTSPREMSESVSYRRLRRMR
jgi:hypothetical protein